jgi:hypothetical protein
MGLVRLSCFFNRVQRIERYSTTSSKMIKMEFHKTQAPRLNPIDPLPSLNLFDSVLVIARTSAVLL